MSQEMELVHSPKYSAAMEAAKKFVGSTQYRVILTFVQHTADGHIVATDSHRMLRVLNVHGFGEEKLINPRSYEMAKGLYPDATKVFPQDTHNCILLDTEQVKVWYEVHKAMVQVLKAMKARMKIATISFEKDSFNMSAMYRMDKSIRTNLPYTEYHKPEQQKLTYNIEYMCDALEAHIKLNSEMVIVKVTGAMSLFVLDNEVDVQALVLPVRTNS